MGLDVSTAEKGYGIENGPNWLGGTADPSAGAGVAAPIGSEYWRNNGGTAERWIKTGVGDTAWTLESSGGTGSTEDNFQNSFMGKSGVGSETPDYAARSAGAGQQIGNNDDLELAIAKIDDKIGANLTPEVRTQNPTIAANEVHQNLSSLDKAIGDDADISSANFISNANTVQKNLSNLDAQVATLTTGVEWYTPSPKCITDDSGLNAASNGTALSGLLPFSDDDTPVLTISDFADGDYICSRNNPSGQKMFRVYDDAGTLRITTAGATQLTTNDTFFVRYDLLLSPGTEEKVSAYRLNSSGNILLFARISVENADTIALTSGYTPTSGNPAVGDTVETALEKVDGNVDAVNSSMGIAQGATNMGTYTGDIITDNQSAKQNIQELETKIDSINKEITDTLVASVQKTVDTIAISATARYEWNLLIYETATPANAYACIITAIGNNGGTSDSSRDNIDVIPNSTTAPTVSFNVTVSGGNLLLQLTSDVASTVKIVRKLIASS